MAEPAKVLRVVLTTMLLVLIAVLVLQALGYGLGFFFDPASGLGEFASPPPPGEDALTVALIGLVGVGMLGAAALLATSGVMVLRRRAAGSYAAMFVGAVYVLAGVSVLRADWAWDAYFYLGSGIGLVVLAAMVRWAQASQPA